MDRLKDRMSQYMDAGFPILYISSFEDERIDMILKGSGALGEDPLGGSPGTGRDVEYRVEGIRSFEILRGPAAEGYRDRP